MIEINSVILKRGDVNHWEGLVSLKKLGFFLSTSETELSSKFTNANQQGVKRKAFNLGKGN